jgi:RNA polymerase sigma-70 factor (ECF subfamily)
MLDNPADAEDAAQNALVSAYKALPRFRMQSRVSTWIYRIAVNQCLSIRRSRRPECQVEQDFSDDPPRYEEIEKRQAVRRLLRGLAPHFKAVLILRYYRQLSYEEIAEVLGWSSDKVKCYLHRARNVFKDAYVREQEDGGVL